MPFRLAWCADGRILASLRILAGSGGRPLKNAASATTPAIVRTTGQRGKRSITQGFSGQSQGGHPLSKMIFHAPSGPRRQIELKVPICFPVGSFTGPLLKASVPESSTSTISGSHENGAASPSKNRFHAVTTAAFPRNAFFPPKIASSETYEPNASSFRSAIVRANAASVARTWAVRESIRVVCGAAAAATPGESVVFAKAAEPGPIEKNKSAVVAARANFM